MSSRRAGVRIALCASIFCCSIGSANAAVTGVSLSLLGHTSLPSMGQDGTVKARGQNGNVAILGNYAFVAGGSKNHGALSTPGRICTDFGGVKVVDLTNPAAPTVIGQVNIADIKTVLTGPEGNPRRDATIPNVATTASSVDVFHNPVDNKNILAISTERCEQSFFDGARVEFWDVTDPRHIPSTPIGVYDPQTVLNPLCSAGPPEVCPPGVSPPDGRWGIMEQVRMFSRQNGPGGSTKVYALVTSPFSIGNQGGVSFIGDFRVLDVTDPTNPVQVSSFPNVPIGQSSNNGCRTFQSARASAPTPDGTHALVSYYDGAQPPGSPTVAVPSAAVEPLRADFGSQNSAAVFDLNLDNMPTFATGIGNDANPDTFSPSPPVWGYPTAADGGLTASGAIAPEGNAADVQSFTGPNGEIMALVSEDGVDPAVTQLTIDSPTSAAYTGRGCAMLGDFAKVYLQPNQTLAAPVAYVGRGCPASTLINSTLLAADPYLADPKGKIALLESGGDSFNGCSLARKMQRASAAGAVGVMTNIGGNFLSLSNAGPDGGIPPIPSVGIQLAAFNLMAGAVPSQVLSGTTFPTTWQGSTATNVTVKPLASALGCATPPGGSAITPESCIAATNTSPIEIRTALPHGIVTGDHVTIAGVAGNTAANGNFTVTVGPQVAGDSPANTVLTLNGSAGNGTYTGGGYAVLCPPATPACSPPAPRTDLSRFRSVANATDPVASVQTKAASQWPVNAGQSYIAQATLEVSEFTTGTYNAFVDWYDSTGTLISSSTIASLSAVTPRTSYSATVTAPAGAVKAALRFTWAGAGAVGTAYADSPSFVPSDLHVSLKDNQGAWGAQKLINFSANPPALVGTYRSPTSQMWPPPTDGVYMPVASSILGNQLAFSSWMSDGLRVVDLSNPSSPKELAAYVPPAVADPSPLAGAGPSNSAVGGEQFRGASWPTQPLVTGVATERLSATLARVVITDINGGLYVLNANLTNSGGPVVRAVASVLTRLTIRPTSFKAARKGSSIGKKGGRVRYSLTLAATTRFTVGRAKLGRTRGRTCRPLAKSNRKGRKCTFYVTVKGSFQTKDKAGLNQFTFTGRLGGSTLKKGNYRLDALPVTPAGVRGKVAMVGFRIK